MKRLLQFFTVLVFSLSVANAAPFTITYPDFQPGTDIIADEVDTNNADIVAEINALTGERIVDGTLTAVDLAPDSVTEPKIVDDAVHKEHIYSDVAGDGLGQTAGALIVKVDDVTIETNADALRLKDGGITNAKVNAAAAIVGSKLDLTNDIVTADVVDGTLLNEDINASAAIAGTKISPDFGSQDITTTGDISCSDFQMTTGATVDYILRSDASGNASWSAIGPLSLAEDSVTSSKIDEADGTTGQDTNSGSGVKTAHIQAGAITGGEFGKIAEATIDGFSIAAGVITGGFSGHIKAKTIDSFNMDYTIDITGDRDNPSWGYRGTAIPTGVVVSSAVGWTDFDCDSYYDGIISSGEIIAILWIESELVASTGGYTRASIRPNGASWNFTQAPYVIAKVGAGGADATDTSILLMRTDAGHTVEYYTTMVGDGSHEVTIRFLGYLPASPQ